MTPIRIVIIYLVIGVLWIVLSDMLVASIIKDPNLQTQIQTYKGWGYVFVTGLLLYELIRRGERSTKRSEEELRASIESIVDAIVVVDARGRLVLTNQAARDFWGLNDIESNAYRLWDFSGQLAIHYMNGEPVSKGEMPLARALRGEKVEANVLVIHNSQTEHDAYVRTSAAPISSDGRIIGAVAVARDVTDLVELDRLKNEFIMVTAHELRTPVAIVKGYAQALERLEKTSSATLSSEQRLKILDAINRGTERLSNIIEDLLEITQFELGRIELKQEHFDLADLVKNLVEKVAVMAPKHTIKITQIDSAEVDGDKDRLSQVVTQFLKNAITYSPQGGDIEVAVVGTKQQVVVSVTDHGIGIPKNRQSRVFERLYRAHMNTPYDYGGLGIGLYISRETIQAHHGRVWFISEPGKGSTFYFSIPLAQGQQLPAAFSKANSSRDG
jgi:signal transduction histidine kinase